MAFKKKKKYHTLDYCTVKLRELFFSLSGERQEPWERTGGRPGSGQNLCCDPAETMSSRPRMKAER